MHTELPTVFNVFKTDCDLQYSHTRVVPFIKKLQIIKGYHYCNSLDRAFQLVISENLSNVVLAIGYIAVAYIYCKGNVGLK